MNVGVAVSLREQDALMSSSDDEETRMRKLQRPHLVPELADPCPTVLVQGAAPRRRGESSLALVTARPQRMCRGLFPHCQPSKLAFTGRSEVQVARPKLEAQGEAEDRRSGLSAAAG